MRKEGEILSAKPVFSMTGFGMGAAENEHATVRVELRSVNNRGQKLGVRARPGLGVYEKDLRDLIGDRLLRGSIDVTVNLSRKLSLDAAPLLEETAAAAIHTLRALADKLGLSDNLTARDLLEIPGIFDAGLDESVTEEEWPLVQQALQLALKQMTQMRQAEGAATAGRLLEIVQAVEEFRVNARSRAPEVVEKQRLKLRERLAELQEVRDADHAALERELLFFADRADINEEMDRLTSHVAQFRQTIENGGEIGKRLDFLAQEMLREVNTTASKANDLQLTKLAVDAKMAVEKIKEQAANLE